MAIWLIRAEQGVGGEKEVAAAARVVVGVPEVENLKSFKNKAALRDHLKEVYPNDSDEQVASQATSLWRFLHKLQRNENVLVPINDGENYMLGSLESAYRYLSEAEPPLRHSRAVFWRSPAVSKADIGDELLSRLETPDTLSQVTPVETENQVIDVFNRLSGTGFVKDGFRPE